MSTPTNKLATYFGDDKPTSRSVGRWIGIGFACVKHCARGFTTASSRERWYLSRINHCEGAITAAISHDEQALSRDKAAITTARWDDDAIYPAISGESIAI